MQSDTSLDSEDSCVSVIFVPGCGSPGGHAHRSTSHSSGSSDSPPGQTASPPAARQLPAPALEDPQPGKPGEEAGDGVLQPSETVLPADPAQPGPLAPLSAELSGPPLSPHPRDCPIVRHHPLFAKVRPGTGPISSLLLGENIEYTRKPGMALSQGVQTVRKSSPKLLTFEIYNPETDDLDSDSSLSSSPDSGESVISVISDIKNAESLEKEEKNDNMENIEVANGDPIESLVFRFDTLETASKTEVLDSIEQKDTTFCPSPMIELDEIERKSEERKRILMSLLDENKSVLENISEKSMKRGDSVSEAAEEVQQKTARQLERVEQHCLGRPGRQNIGPAAETGEWQSSSRSTKDTDRASPSDDLLQTDAAQEQEKTDDSRAARDQDRVPIEICITEHKSEAVELQSGSPGETDTDLTNKVQFKDDKIQEEDSRDIPKTEGNQAKKLKTKTALIVEDKKEDKIENGSKAVANEVVVQYRGKLELKKRDDSLDSNSASVKSCGVQLSDSGSLHSHRFSTISISSNVSSEVSLGNTSVVSGSSCYLASMSSADFDDRPALASSFSLSEAEEGEQRTGEAETEVGVDDALGGKKDQERYIALIAG